MTNLNVTLSTILKKLGVNTASAEAQTLLGNAALATIEVPDEISNSLNKDFFTLDSALQHPEILTKARAEALNGIDAHVESLWEGSGLDADTITQLKAEKKTTARISKTIELIKAKKDAAFSATGKEKQDLVNEINSLQNKLIEDNKKFEVDLNTERSGRKLDKINWTLDEVYNALDYASPTEKAISVHAAKAIVSKIASDKGIVFEMGDNGLSLKTTAGTDYVQDNTKLSPKDFITKTLMESKFLKVSGGGQGSQQNIDHTHQHTGADGKVKDNDYLRSIKKDYTANPLPAPTP